MTLINPKTNKAEYLLHLFRFVQLNLPNHTCQALGIISSLSEYKLFSGQVVNLLLKSLGSASEYGEIVAAFVEILESNEEIGHNDDNRLTLQNALNEIDDGEIRASEIVNNEKCHALNQLSALQLILFYVRQPAPNLAHLLLGVDLQKPLKEHVFHSAGTRISAPLVSLLNGKEPDALSVPRNCLHSVILLLTKFLNEPSVWMRLRSAIELSYELLYTLCLSPAFSQRLLYFLRTEHDFVYKHLRQAPFKTADMAKGGDPKSLETGLCALNSWVLNLACVELQNLVANKAKAQLKKLVQLLVESSESAG